MTEKARRTGNPIRGKHRSARVRRSGRRSGLAEAKTRLLRKHNFCVSRQGTTRMCHEYDKDGVCYWCDRSVLGG